MKEKIFFNVDTQKDFMNKDGALYVSNAESIKGNLSKLTQYAIKNNIQIVASVDKHFGTKEFAEVEAELTKYGGPFPNHCMHGTEGYNQITETSVDDQIVLSKQTYDVFTNPFTKTVLSEVKDAVVYGVATDYCVKAAVLGMLALGIKVIVVSDAIMGVDETTTKKAIDRMKRSGAMFRTTEEIIKE